MAQNRPPRPHSTAVSTASTGACSRGCSRTACGGVQLAREVHLTVTPTLERVRRLESAVHRGYFARLNPARLGLGLLAYVEVLLDRTTPDAFERFSR